jgi:hypothetical protein
MSRYLSAGLIAMTFLVGLPNLAFAQASKVDCGRLGFSFAQASDAASVECYRSRQSEPAGGDSPGDVWWTFETMFVTAHDHVVRITKGVAGREAYFGKTSVRSLMEGLDELEAPEKWESEPDFSHYQILRFHAKAWNYESECFGFVKYGSARVFLRGGSGGASNLITGYACWQGTAPDRATIEALLNAIKSS